MAIRNSLIGLATTLAMLLALPLSLAAQGWGNDLDVPYVPTPRSVVDKMLSMAGVGSDDLLYDLGSGDGRIVITAAEKFGARAVGVDIDPVRIGESRANAEAAGVEDRVRFVQGDLFDTDLSEATVVTLYLLGSVNDRLRPKLLDELSPGTRVVSHAFDMGEWKPKESAVVSGSTVYLWVVPAQAGGRWEGVVQRPGGQQQLSLILNQTLQQLDGMAVMDGAHLMLNGAEVEGEQLELEITDGAGDTQRLEGTINGDTIEGRVYAAADGRFIGDWQVTRTPLATEDELQTIDSRPATEGRSTNPPDRSGAAQE